MAAYSCAGCGLVMASQSLDSLTGKLLQVSDTYARKFDIVRDADWYVLKLAEEVGELTAEHLRLGGRGHRKEMSETQIRDALADEAADILAMTLLFAHQNGIDLTAALERKWFCHLAPKSQGVPE